MTNTSTQRPQGHYTGPLDRLRWDVGSQTLRADPMNYLAADLSRIDASLWGRESELGALLAEAPAMLAALRHIFSLCKDVNEISLTCATILARIDGEVSA